MSPEVRNRDALRDYTIDSTLEAGIVLTGAEVKSVRMGQASFAGGYAAIDRKGAFVYGLHIEPYRFAGDTRESYEPARPKQLLLKTKELAKLRAATQAEGYTLVPLKLYFKKALIKVELGLGKGKKKFDKRADLKDKTQKRETEKYFKYSKR